MTENGTFIINGTERVIVSQLHRSPGRLLLAAREGRCSRPRSSPTAAAGWSSSTTPRTCCTCASTASASSWPRVFLRALGIQDRRRDPDPHLLQVGPHRRSARASSSGRSPRTCMGLQAQQDHPRAQGRLRQAGGDPPRGQEASPPAVSQQHAEAGGRGDRGRPRPTWRAPSPWPTSSTPRTRRGGRWRPTRPSTRACCRSVLDPESQVGLRGLLPRAGRRSAP